MTFFVHKYKELDVPAKFIIPHAISLTGPMLFLCEKTKEKRPA